MLGLIVQPLVDQTSMNTALQWLVRFGVPLSAILLSAGFFLAIPAGAKHPGRMRNLIYAGAILLAISALTLGLGLLTT